MIFLNDLALDAQADYIIANANSVHLLTVAPTTYASVLADSLGSYAPTITKINYTGVGGGRAAAIAAATVTIDTATNHAGVDQTVTHYAILDDTTSAIIGVNTITNRVVSNGDTANVPQLLVVATDAISI